MTYREVSFTFLFKLISYVFRISLSKKREFKELTVEMTQEKRNELNIKLGQALADTGTAYRNVQEWQNKLGEYDLSARNLIVDIKKIDAELAKQKSIAEQEARKEQDQLKLVEAANV